MINVASHRNARLAAAVHDGGSDLNYPFT
jgi:hypothetical protein